MHLLTRCVEYFAVVVMVKKEKTAAKMPVLELNLQPTWLQFLR